MNVTVLGRSVLAVVIAAVALVGCDDSGGSPAGDGPDAQVGTDRADGAPGAPGGFDRGGGGRPAPIDLGEYLFGPSTVEEIREIFIGRISGQCIEAGYPSDCVRVKVVVESPATPLVCGDTHRDHEPGTVLFTRLDPDLPTPNSGPAVYAYPGDTVTIFGAPCVEQPDGVAGSTAVVPSQHSKSETSLQPSPPSSSDAAGSPPHG
ncbi:hypothetical protein KTR9_1080 [Gordonia sp. KTR9]|nr:hypothetical protein KTR9_1080 [Gordonia sp. KTR9]